MTKLEAIAAMKAGRKVRHKTYFTKDEWVRLYSIKDSSLKFSDALYEFEDGCICPSQEFWLFRKDAYWQDGWEII